jgi:hypothetical protein
VAQIEFGVDLSLGGSIEEIVDERERVPILFGDEVEFPIVDAEAERTILLPGEEDWSAMSGIGRVNEAVLEMFI